MAIDAVVAIDDSDPADVYDDGHNDDAPA